MHENSEIWMTVYVFSISLVVTSFARVSVYVLDYSTKETNVPIISVISKHAYHVDNSVHTNLLNFHNFYFSTRSRAFFFYFSVVVAVAVVERRK